MFRMGDEFMHTQEGNNNPYNQDNEISWLNWVRLEENQEVFEFFKRMIAFRKSHAGLGRSTFWRDDVHWYGAERPEVDMSQDSRSLAYCLQCDNAPSLYVMFNGSKQSSVFGIHANLSTAWKRVIDTSLPYPLDIADTVSATAVDGPNYRLNPHCVAVLLQS